MKEHLRRMALWAKAVNYTPKWPHWIVFDVAKHVNPSIRAPSETVDLLKRHLDNTEANIFACDICSLYLHWAAIRNSAEVKSFALPGPYEAVMLMFERGGFFYVEHGFVGVDIAMIPPSKTSVNAYASSTPVVELDIAVLDKIDAEASAMT
jgi:hypothetical protein